MKLNIDNLKLKTKAMSKDTIHIYRASRGGYKKPVPLREAGLNFVDENGNSTEPPTEKLPCEHPKHWEWGNGTRNGQKLYYPAKEMLYQKYHLTKKQMMEAVRQYDMASLEMRGRTICQNCANNINH